MDIEDLHRKFQRELNAGTVSLVLLALLARAGEPQYGYQIAKQLEAVGGATGTARGSRGAPSAMAS